MPDVLRTPLVHSYVVNRYRFDHAVGPFDLLVPRGDTPIDWDYWRGVLGTSLNLGRLPAATTAQHGATCVPDSDDCVGYLRISAQSVTEPTTRTLEVSTGAGPFTVTYEQRPGDKELFIPLDRLWFSTGDDVELVPSLRTSGRRATAFPADIRALLIQCDPKL